MSTVDPSAVDLSRAPATVVDALRRISGIEDHGYTFLDNANKPTFFSYAALWRAAETRGLALLGHGLTRGDRVAMVLSQPQDFVITFLGALLAGLVPVPMFPPLSFGKLDAYADSAVTIIEVAGAKLIVTDKALSSILWQVVPRVPTLKDLVVVENLDLGKKSPGPLPTLTADDLAFLQFTSGSTSAPKGVMVTHKSLVANCWAIATEGMGLELGSDVAVSWLPLYHDMGLIGFVITPLFKATDVVFIPTLSFVKRPNIWLQTMHEFKGTLSFGPNFAFALATKRASEKDLATWDLSRVRLIGCGAEPINANVMLEFVDRFAGCGLKPGVPMPAYGMAEATLAMSFAPVGSELPVLLLDAEAFRGEGRVVNPDDDALALSFVGCGKPFKDHRIGILDTDGKLLGEDREGEIAFAGPSLTEGYWKNEAATNEVYRPLSEGDGDTTVWLRTGDLGFLHEGNVFITGRSKDLIILNGRNHHPQSIEWSVAEIDGVRKGNVVAFSRPGKESEELVVVAETRADPPADLKEAIALAVADRLSLKVADVVLLGAGQLPKTSSGKLQRRKTREQYLAGELGGEGVRTLGATGEKLTVARHLARSLFGRATHAASKVFNRPS
ncbi:MAG: fatty acyl-AMP ligase [Pseudomonadota bacterium]|nr:fatty acyl-AMP ligase [Pseudomonadota bacterium]